MPQIPVSDLVSLVWFLVVWIGYTLFADGGRSRAHSLRAVMHAHRLRWMLQMLQRQNRMVDTNILGNLLRGVSFFASTTLLILAGLVTILGATDKAILLIREIPFAAKTTLLLWEVKLLLLIVVFVHAFFKFTWALRQFNYCSILIGAAPGPAGKPPDAEFAGRAADMSTLASKDFNQGLRAYYFGLAALAWFFSPWAFILATTLVAIVLYWREYHSDALQMLEFAGAPSRPRRGRRRGRSR